jgi:hypothetical protein
VSDRIVHHHPFQTHVSVIRMSSNPRLPSLQPSLSLTTISSQSMPTFRRQSSSASFHSSPSRSSPKVQLIPHARTASFETTLTEAERDLLDQTNFDDEDLSSQDFDFEDIFTYDKPQRRLPKVVEVTTRTSQRDWSNFSFSHYSARTATRPKVNRSKSGVSEMYLKNQIAQVGTGKN